MGMPTDQGRYIARPLAWKVEQTGQNKLPTFVCQFSLAQWYDGTQWLDVSAEHLEITGYFYLFKKDGTKNGRTCDDITAAYGWDGRSFASLAGGDWANVEVQITVEAELYNGQTKMKVKWLNPRDSDPVGGVGPSDPGVVSALDAQFGAMLRATAPASTAKPNGSASASKPAAAPARPAASAPAAADNAAAKSNAWKTFLSRWTEYATNYPDEAQYRDVKWKGMVADELGAADPTKAPAADWKRFADKLAMDGIPAPVMAAAGTQFTDDEIPF